MALSYGFRPRGPAERLRMARALAAAPAVVEVQGDDGWAAAALAVSGRLPVAGAGCDLQRVERTLRRLGLPRLGRALPAAILTADLRLEGHAEPGRLDTPRVDGPLVSVIVVTRNRADRLRGALLSLLSQSWPCEILVVDDGSTDATPDVVASIPGVRALSPGPVGRVHALNLAFAEATGDAFLVLDDGDGLLPGAVRVLAHALYSRPELSAVTADSIEIDLASGAPQRWVGATTLPAPVLAAQTPFAPPGRIVLVRREAVERAGPLNPARGDRAEADLYAHVAFNGRLEGVPIAVHLHRRAEAEAPPAVPAHLGRTAAVSATHRLVSPAPPPTEAVVVIDDGDVGALEETLHRHARGRAVWVDLEVPRDPMEVLRAHWPGTYAVRERVHRWVTHSGPVHLRLSSAPDWAPPPIRGAEDLPDLPGPDAVIALAAALGWPFPSRTRGVHLRVAHPVTRAIVQARLAIRKGQPKYAVNPIAQVLKLAPDWRAGWVLAAEVFDSLGYANEAASCRRQALNCRSAAA